MPEYLTKEEVRQWRSSLERITLEEYAARLGKVIQEEKHTNDMIDKVMTTSLHSLSDTPSYRYQSEKIQTIALKPIEKKEKSITEKEVTDNKKSEKNVTEVIKENKCSHDAAKNTKKSKISSVNDSEVETQEVTVTFKKPLIPREQLIYDYLLKNKNIIVYAKDMAALLEVPRDYVYKYIKNLRQKINEEVLFNAENGGYVLKV